MNELIKKGTSVIQSAAEVLGKEGTEAKSDVQERNQEKFRDQMAFHVNKIQSLSTTQLQIASCRAY